MLEQVVRAAVDGLLRNHVVAGLREGLQRVGNGGGARSHGQASHAAFKCGDAVLEHALGGVRQAAVDVAGIGQAEAVGGVLGVAEHVTRGLVNGHRAGVAGGIGGFLADVQLQGVEAEGVLGVIDELAHWNVSLHGLAGFVPAANGNVRVSGAPGRYESESTGSSAFVSCVACGAPFEIPISLLVWSVEQNRDAIW